ncbi:hypothetical protein CYMTET_40383 [Cymbomonas tetramitiformis]|uniref:Uncharacterized protein n=1 Tax=Cymbomonas tetramitiformis TaxID=36881 RepID=A0AAE0C862_9CHLO|nr:hypothetical protein CYMTET_40383 [Cymbomonas tetramitiformis]
MNCGGLDCESSTRNPTKVIFCFGGLLTALICYGVFQERIMTTPYGAEKEMFQATLLLVCYNRLSTVLVSASFVVFFGESLKPVGPLRNYAAVSFANIAATACQFEALKYVSFLVQTLVKTGKLFPVMIWGTIMLKKKYKFRDYAAAVAILLGVTIFLLTGEVTARSQRIVPTLRYGYASTGALLLILHLGFDGFASTFQDKLFHSHQMSSFQQSLHVTLWSSLLSFLGLLLKGELLPAVSFVLRHPDILVDMTLLSIAATSSQMLISYTIKSYGAILFATVQTTRQFLSILISCILFKHAVTIGQAFGTALVFAALMYRAYKHEGRTSKDGFKDSEAQIDKCREDEARREGKAYEEGDTGTSKASLKNPASPQSDAPRDLGPSTLGKRRRIGMFCTCVHDLCPR